MATMGYVGINFRKYFFSHLSTHKLQTLGKNELFPLFTGWISQAGFNSIKLQLEVNHCCLQGLNLNLLQRPRRKAKVLFPVFEAVLEPLRSKLQ